MNRVFVAATLRDRGGPAAAMAAAAACALALGVSGEWDGLDQPARARQPTGSYVLVDTWRNEAGNLPADSWRDVAGIDVTGDGTIYVADKGARRITVIDPDESVRLFRPPGAEPYLVSPRHLAADAAARRLYVADAGADAVHVFALDGSHVGTWPGNHGATGIALDPDGTVVVALTTSGRIRRLDRGGTVVNEWQAVPDDGNGDLLRGLHVADDRQVFAVDGRTSHVLAYNPDGTPAGTLRPKLARAEVRDLAVARHGSGQQHYRYWLGTSFGLVHHEARADYWATSPVGDLSAIAVSPTGGIPVATTGRPDGGSQVLRIPFDSATAVPERRWGAALFAPGTLAGPEALVVGADGHILILDRGARVQRYSQDGLTAGQLEHANPVHAGTAPDGTVYVTDGAVLRAYDPGSFDDGGAALWDMPIATANENANAVGLVYSPAEDGLVLLDGVQGRLRRFGRDGSRGSETALRENPDSSTVWSDLASGPDGKLNALDRTSQLVHVVAPDSGQSTIALPAPARRLATAPDGSLLTLGRDGWVRRYDSSGMRTAAFDAARFDASHESSPADLDVTPSGDVYVADRAANLVSRYTWDPAALSEEPPSNTSPTCRNYPDKVASPSSIELGDTVEVQLTVRGGCGGGVSAEALDIILILDRSGSMEGERLRILKEAALNFVADVDFADSRVGVVSFNESATRDVGLTADARRVRDAVRGLRAGGETALHEGLETARDEVARRGRSDVGRVFVLFSDGDSDFDRAVAQARAAKNDGVEIYTIGIQAWQALMRAIATDADHYYAADNARFLYGLFERISERVTTATLFRTIEVVDEIPVNMRYVAGSSQPPARLAGRTLRWTLTNVTFNGFGLRYLLEPDEPGEWPTNAAAWADFVDGFGAAGRLDFPVPRISVRDPQGPTPTLTATATIAPDPTVTPHPTSTPRPTAAPAPIHLPLALREECKPGERHADVVLVMDTSSSMQGRKLAAAKEAALLFVRLLDLPNDQIGVVSFDSTSLVVAELNWQPHIHALVTDGGFRPDGTFVRLPAHSTQVLTEAFRRGMLKLFVERELFEPEVAEGMLEWFHSGFSVHDGVWLDEDDAAAHERLARYCARCPVSLERLEYDRASGTVSYASDKADGPTAGRHTFEAVEFIARLVAHIPDKGQVMQRYYGYYANRTRGERRKAEAAVAEPSVDAGLTATDPELPDDGVTIVEPEDFSRGDAKRRWAELIRLVYEVYPLKCPRCGGEMRVMALIQEPAVIDKILRHLRNKGRDARAGPWATGPPGGGTTAEAA